ncbi:ATP-binding cassette domain-containing protein [uncultured Clostridium sp.]|uniref:ABC transporter ATP-binding protein n=1 Tax=uncultured Clostridium sp. TaxID=59620 RepID=UPI00262EC050|nr:ATP-binding cassette domain-containing protein [uncultured Clostridium sp.]
MKILKVNNIDYKIRERDILKDISLEIKEREIISIIGESGSGKSTLLKVLSDLVKKSSGEISYRGKSYNDINPIKLRQNISYCVQLPYLFGKKVEDNFKFIFEVRKDKYDKKRVLEVLNEFKISEDYLDKQVDSLSGGEKQRIAIARNLIYKPDVLLLDEATSALDNENTLIVETYIEKLNKEGVTVLWVTHSEEQSLRIFGKRIIMKNGIIEEIEILEKMEVVI